MLCSCGTLTDDQHSIHDIGSGAGSIAGAASGWSSLSTGAKIAMIIGGIVLVVLLVLGVRRYRNNDSAPAPRLDPRMLNGRNCTGFQHRDKPYRHIFDDAPDDERSLPVSRLDPRSDARLVPDMASIAFLPALRPAQLPSHRLNMTLCHFPSYRHLRQHERPVHTSRLDGDRAIGSYLPQAKAALATDPRPWSPRAPSDELRG